MRPPNRWEVDPQPEPDQATWAKLTITVERSDGGIVEAEIIRPRSWILANSICAGRLLPLNLPELDVSGLAMVTSIDDCPPIADGEGSVVTARFVTREVHVVASVDVLGADGTVETITGTTIHPVWSVDRKEWVPLNELIEGETLQGLEGLAVVLSVTLSRVAEPVYNIEVHGEHVYQVGELGLVVHNACSDELINLARSEVAAGFMTRGGKLITFSKTLSHEALALTVSNLTYMADKGHAIAFTVGKKLDDTIVVMGSGRFQVPGGFTEAMKGMVRKLVQ